METLMAAMITTKARRRITDTATYMETQALGWIARTNKGHIGYADDDPFKAWHHTRLKKAVTHLNESGVDLPEKKYANEALRQNSPITSQKLGKVMKKAWETSIPRDGKHRDKHATLGWPSQTEAEEALRAIGEGDSDDYTKMAAVRWLW